ncbi:MAG TPA: hypothetical protein VG651_08480 [Stellaceae bacterium]|nr:hypothetical protein [Stellaceae bacterium]
MRWRTCSACCARFGENAGGCAVVAAGGEFAAAYAAEPGTAWLIRPDGHIGWCSAAPTTAGLRSYLGRLIRLPAADV